MKIRKKHFFLNIPKRGVIDEFLLQFQNGNQSKQISLMSNVIMTRHNLEVMYN